MHVIVAVGYLVLSAMSALVWNKEFLFVNPCEFWRIELLTALCLATMACTLYLIQHVNVLLQGV